MLFKPFQLLFFLAAVMVLTAVSAPGAATDAAERSQVVAAAENGQAARDGLRERDRAAFEEWRTSIPDYEKRLYDRIKKINRRTVRLMQIVVWGFALIAIAFVVVTVVVLQRLRTEARAPGERSSAPETSQPLPAPPLQKKVLVFAAFLILPLIGLEVWARTAVPDVLAASYVPGIWALDPCWTVGLAPDLVGRKVMVPGISAHAWHITSTGQGFRANNVTDRDRRPQRQGSIRPFRIAVFGTSYSFGWGIDDEDVWSAQLESLLNNEKVFPEGVQVLNFSNVTSGSFTSFIRGFHCSVARFEPDLVIAATVPPPRIKIPDQPVLRRLMNPPAPDWAERSNHFIDDQGYLRLYKFKADWVRFFERNSIFVQWAISRVRQSRDRAHDRTPSLRKIAEQTEENSAGFKLFANMLRDRHIPYLHLIREGASPEVFARHGITNVDPWGGFEKSLRDAGIPVVNTSRLFRPHVTGEFYLPDGHWTPRSHRIIADLVFDAVVAQKEKIVTSRDRRRGASK